MADLAATIFEIREFCLHDGPGLRTTVFLKGCPLRCLWCHNPEGQSPQPERMVLSSRECLHCGECARVCPQGIDSCRELSDFVNKCQKCGSCVKSCPAGRLRLCGERVTAAELATRINRNREVLLSSGGVTFSGGEPLLYISYLKEVAELLAPLSVAVETCGHVPETDYRTMLGFADFVLQDWKCASPELHRRLTGASNELIRNNIHILAASGIPFVLRLPLVPGLNDSDAELESAAAFFAVLPRGGLREVQLLPYHPGGEAKLRQLGLPSRMPELPSRSVNPAALEIFRRVGLPVSWPFGGPSIPAFHDKR